MEVEQLIPHRPPFLLINRIIDINANTVRVAATPKQADELWSRVYSGHYPNNPITPGVLLCEMVFQAAGCLAAFRNGANSRPGAPILTRIQGAKFKAIVRPGDELEVQAELIEEIGPALFMKGKVLAGKTTVLQLDFAVTWQ